MRYIVDMALFGMLPEFTRVVLMVRDLDNTRNAAASRNMLQKAARAASEITETQPQGTHSRLAPWHRAYQAFGLAGLSGTQQGVPSPLIFATKNTPLANVINAFALQNVLPAGGDDLDKITGNVWLRPARGTELFMPVGQPEQSESPEIAEIVYVDDGPHVLRRKWHGTPGNAAPITQQTEAALIYLDCLPPIDQAGAEELAGQLAKLITGFFNAQVETHMLTRQRPALQIET